VLTLLSLPVRYEKGGQLHTEHGIVVIATGGFGADFSDHSLLSQVEAEWRQLPMWKEIPYLPPLRSLPTTNGDHCTGDGIKMAMEIGAGLTDMALVQVHPTGLVHPDEPDAKVRSNKYAGRGGRSGRVCEQVLVRRYVKGGSGCGSCTAVVL